MQNNELTHYGIPGMKWGVRRAKKKREEKERLKQVPKSNASGKEGRVQRSNLEKRERYEISEIARKTNNRNGAIVGSTMLGAMGGPALMAATMNPAFMALPFVSAGAGVVGMMVNSAIGQKKINEVKRKYMDL